jgi:hypothetical protein
MQANVRRVEENPEMALVSKDTKPGPLDEPGFTFTPTGLDIEPWVKFGAWQRYGRKLQLAEKGIQWALGDWMIWGETTFKERAAQAVEFTGLKIKTLQNYATVAEAIPKSRRRDSDVVDFSTHCEVVGLPDEDQERILDEAAKEPEKMTRKEVRREVHRIKRRTGKAQSEIEIVHTPEVQGYLQRYIDTLKELEESVPLTARFLRNMAQSHASQAYWQKNRTVADDCEIIQMAVKKNGGEIGEDDLYKWLVETGYFMSDPEFEERLEYMNRDDVRLALVTDAGSEGKQEERRGKLPAIVAVPWRKIWDQGSKRQRDEDDED